MGEPTERVNAQIEEARRALDRDLSRLETKVQQRLDWRSQIRRLPWLAVCCGAVVGLFVGKLMRG